MLNKGFLSKLNDIADWIIRLVVLNVMMIFFSLGILTIFPAISAGYHMFSEYVRKNNPKLFAGFFAFFKTALLRKIIIELLIGSIFFVLYLNIRYYDAYLQEQTGGFYLIGYYISLALIAIWTATTFYTIVVVKVKPTVHYKNLFKLSFFLAGKYYLRTLLLVSIAFIPFLLILFAPVISPLFFVLVGLSSPMLLSALVTKPAVEYLEGIDKGNGKTRH